MLVSTRDFVTRLSESGLSVMLPPDMAAALLKLPTAEEAARQLIESNLLTEFQARVLADGDNVPLIIGDYVVVGSLGRGGMGYVLKARHRRMKRDVAIKFLLKELTASTDMRRRFEREVEAAAQLNHQNIVTAYDAGEHTDGSCYLVMQFVDGDDLSHLVKANGPLKLPQAIDIICQAAEGLAFAHDKGIVHRDIKPGNLLLDKDGVVRILDMGLARMRPSPGDSIEGGAHADLTNTGSVMGTIDYMAPEQALDAKSADHRADIYSLGCTLWFLLSGNPPYRSDTIMRRLLAHREQQIPSVRSLWPDAPSELDDIFKSMMAKSKEDRFPSMRHLIVALRGLDKEDLEVGQMATMDVAEESAFSAQRSQSERFRPPSSPTAPLALSEQQIKGAKPVLPAATPADPTVIQNGDASSARETATFSNNESRVARRPRKKTSRAAGSSRSAVVQTPTKSPVPSKRVALIAGVSVLVIALAVALWSTRKPAAPTNDTTEIVQSGEGQQPESSSTPTPTPPAPPPLAIAPFDATQARAYQEAWAKHLGVNFETTTSAGGAMVLIPPSDAIPKPYFLGKYEVTQAEWEKVMGYNPSDFGPRNPKVTGMDTGKFPVEQVNWFDSVEFCNKLSEKDGLKPYYQLTVKKRTGSSIEDAEVKILGGIGYHIPTDAEWTHGCAAGSTTKYHFGDRDEDLSEYAWYGVNTSIGRPHNVGEKKPNAFGLYDTHGNVRELNEDELSNAATKAPERVNRGGAWNHPTVFCLVSNRRPAPLAGRYPNTGLRIARAATIEAPDLPLAKAPFDATQARAFQEAWAKHLSTQVETTNSVGAKMVLIPPGEFLMGSSDEQIAGVVKEVAAVHGQEFADRMKKAEQPQHRVVLSKPFWMGATEVTIGQFRKFAQATQYQTFAEKKLATDAKSWTYLKPGYAVTDESPAAAVTWADAGAYCRWLSEQERTTYRLPTEAEWEYACRAGTASAYYSGDVLLDSHEWSIRNSEVKSHPVALKQPNPFGLFDMHGNLSEWCQDRFDETWYAQSPSNDPVGPQTGATYALRGGNWDYNSFMRSAYRSGRTENVFHYTIGFRVVRVFAPSAMASVTPQPSVPAALNWALKFDGKQSHVRTPLVHGSDTPLTIEFTLLPGPKQYAVVSDSEGKGMGIDILNNSISFLAFRRANGKEDYVRITAPRPLAADRAYRIATVYDSGKLRLFVDGKLEASGDLKGEYLPSNLPFYLGASPEEEGIDYPFTGSLDEVRFSKVARYQADYTPVARLTADANTLALYHFDEGTGDVLRDSSSNNRHGKIIGAEWVRTDGSATTANEQPSDRHAAEWIINRGGAVYLNHSNTKFEKLTDLPSGKIEVRAVDLKKRLPEADVDIDAIRGLTHLEWVTLDKTQATPKAITGLEQATSLKRISLGGFAVTDAHLATLARLPKLNGLFLAGSRLTSQQCRTLATMPGLEKLNLTANPLIDDSSVESLSQLRNLTVLELNGTKVTATGIASLQRVLPNCDIRWDGPSLKTIEQIDSTSKPWIDWLGPKLKRNEIYGGGWVREGNAFTTEKDISGVAILSNNTRNGALRVTYLLRDSKGIVLNARDRTTGGTRELYVAQDNGKDLSIARVRDGSKYHFLAEQAVPENIAKDAPRTLEFRVIGDTLTASFNNSVIATVKDATVPDGNFALVALKGVLIQKVEYQALDGSGVDMLQKIDTARDGIGSSWKMSNGTLQTIAGPSEGDRRLYLPIENAPNEYDIRLKVQRASPRDNALMLCMVTGGRRVGLVMDGFKSRGGLWGLEQIDGKGPPDNGTAVPNEPLKVDTAADVLVQVRKTGIRVERDGKQLINWIGSPEKLSLNAKWDDKGPPRFFLGAQGDFTIHRLNFEPVESSETAWSELFNGKDLAGWEVMGVKGWSVEQGVLLGKTSTTAGNGWLMSERQFGNFELELEYKLSPGSNSGVFLRAWPEGAVDGSQFREIQLLDDDDPKFASVSANRRSGSVFGLVAPSVVPKVPADQWHRVRVHLKDQQLQLTLNDVVVLKHTLTDLRPSGRIGLQLYPNRVEFRNIRVRPVD